MNQVNCWMFLSLVLALLSVPAQTVVSDGIYLFTGGTCGVVFADEDDPFADMENEDGETYEGETASGDGEGKVTTDEVADQIRALREETNRVRFQPKVERDPFVSLIKVQAEGPGDRGPRPLGYEGLDVAELRLSGVWLGTADLGGAQAFLLGPNNRSYQRKVGDKNFNGKIIAIRPDRVIFEEYQIDSTGAPRPPKIITLFVDKRDI